MNVQTLSVASRDALLAAAEQLVVEFPKNIPTESLREKVIAEFNRQCQEQLAVDIPTDNSVKVEPVKAIEPAEMSRSQLRNHAMALVRFKLVVQNPARTKLPAIVLTVANDLIGQVTKVIPTDPAFYEDGFHAPRCIVEQLKTKVYSAYKEVPISKGSKMLRTVLQSMPEFTVIELPPLTPDELKALAARQAATGSLTAE